MQKQKKLKATVRPRTAHREKEAALEAANGYIVRHYPFGCLGGTPQRLVGASGELWIIPVVLTSPGYGAVGEVGLIAVDAGTFEVVNGTQRQEVAQAIKRLKEAKRDELEAAFQVPINPREVLIWR